MEWGKRKNGKLKEVWQRKKIDTRSMSVVKKEEMGKRKTVRL